jgi:hypothetical protein
MVRTLRIEIPVATTATPSSRTIRPMICDPNCAPLSEIGLVAAASTASWPGFALRPVFGAWLGPVDGLICGNRLAALPAGTLIVRPGVPEPMVGSAPIGKAAEPTPLGNATPTPLGNAASRPLAVPSALGVVPPRSPEVEPPEVEPPEVEPPDVEPGEEAAPDFGLETGLGDAGAVATVTAGALAVAVSVEPLPLATETVAENWIVSPAGAVLGTLTCAVICGPAGCPAGRVSS